VVLIVISWVPRLKEVAFFSLMGDVALLVAMSVVIAYGASEFELQPLNHYQQFPMSFTNFADFYGPVVFLFGVHILVVPLQQQMAKPELFEKTLDVSLLIVVISNVAFALFAYLLFDGNISSPITDSLCKDLHHIQNVAQVALIGGKFYILLYVCI
jgi:amino acid permease